MNTPKLQKTHDELSKQMETLRLEVVNSIRSCAKSIGNRLRDAGEDTSRGYIDINTGVVITSCELTLTETIIGVAIEDDVFNLEPFVLDVEHQGPITWGPLDQVSTNSLLLVLKALEKIASEDISKIELIEL